MEWKQASTAATELVATLPSLPQPWDIDTLCVRVAARRGRPLVLHPADMPALPFGFWFDDGTADHVVFRTGASGYHRDHIILHELCHVLAGHNVADQLACPDAGSDRLGFAARATGAATRGGDVSVQEELAEMFASKVLKLATQAEPVSDFERRAAAMLGAG